MIPLHRIGTMLSLGMPGLKSDFVSCLAQRGVRSLGNFGASGQHQHTLKIRMIRSNFQLSNLRLGRRPYSVHVRPGMIRLRGEGWTHFFVQVTLYRPHILRLIANCDRFFVTAPMGHSIHPVVKLTGNNIASKISAQGGFLCSK